MLQNEWPCMQVFVSCVRQRFQSFTLAPIPPNSLTPTYVRIGLMCPILFCIKLTLRSHCVMLLDRQERCPGAAR